ncbi:MAG: hypothetical protein ICV64_10440 [Thermoleophilia bacterium]|nr:hypothetical protein [Thermoleophilia bacterium]
MKDLHHSVAQGRFWRQLGALRDSCATPYLVVEGRTLDAGQLSPAGVRGVCVAVMDRGVRLVRSDGTADTARWLVRIAVRNHRDRDRDRPAYGQRPPASESPAECALAAVPGISVAGARALLECFGSVARVASATSQELAAVPGIGHTKATAIRTTLNPSRASSPNTKPSAHQRSDAPSPFP